MKNTDTESDVTNKMGLSMHKIGKHAEALSFYEKTLKNDPKNINAHKFKGDTLRELKNYDQAIEAYGNAIDFDVHSTDPEPFFSIGTICFERKRYSDAVISFDNAIKIKPENSEFYTNKAQALIKLRKFKEAIECYDKALEFKPADAVSLNRKGTCLFEMENYTEAIDSFNEAIKISPSSSEAYNFKG